jgi:O-antigen/teichoic acid export membrane protein
MLNNKFDPPPIKIIMRQLISMNYSRLYPFVAVADQALQSLINLLSSLFILRFASKEEYGVFSIGIASVLLINGFVHALIMLQMTVIAPEKNAQDRDQYFGSMLMAMYALLALLAVVTLLFVLMAPNWLDDDYKKLILVIVFATPGILTLEFMRQYHFFFSLAHRVLFIDFLFIICYFGALSAFVFLGFTDIHLLTILINGGIAFFFGVAGMLYSSRISVKKAIYDAWGSFIYAWRQGAWAFAGVFISQLQGQGYIFLLAMLKGPSMVAEMNAARLFISPLLVMSTGFSKVMLPKMALLKADGEENKAVALALKVLVLSLSILAIYMLFIAVAWSWIDEFLANKGYENLWLSVALWGLVYLFHSITIAPTELLHVHRKFRVITLAGAVISMVVFLGSIPSIIYYGISGALVVLAIGELVLAIVLWERFKSETRNHGL